MTTEHDTTWPFDEPPREPWNEALAERMADEDGVGALSEAHWKVIYFMREHFIKYGGVPPMRMACTLNAMEPHCVEQLFHSAREAWHLSGLPDPGEEFKSYMD